MRAAFFGGPWADEVREVEVVRRWLTVPGRRPFGASLAGYLPGQVSFVYELRAMKSESGDEGDAVVTRTALYYPARSKWRSGGVVG